MKDNLSIIITMLIFVILLVIFPLYNHFERQDDMSYNLVLKATTNFVDDVLNCGYLTQEMYDNYTNLLANTGNIYDIELEAHEKIYVKEEGSENFIEEYEIKYNKDIFEEVKTASLASKTVMGGAYYFDEGDQFYVKVKNSNTTMAGAIFNVIVPTSSKDTIKVNYGGIIKHEAWAKVDDTYELLSIEYKLKLSWDPSLCNVTSTSMTVSGPGCTIASRLSNESEKKVKVNLKCELIDDIKYQFIGWYDQDGNIISDQKELIDHEIELTKDIILTPKIQENEVVKVKVTGSFYGGIGGNITELPEGGAIKSKKTISGGMEYEVYKNQEIILQDTRSKDYLDAQWSESRFLKYYGNEYKVTCDADKDIKCLFFDDAYNYKAIEKVILEYTVDDYTKNCVKVMTPTKIGNSYKFEVKATRDIVNYSDDECQTIDIKIKCSDGNVYDYFDTWNSKSLNNRTELLMKFDFASSGVLGESWRFAPYNYRLFERKDPIDISRKDDTGKEHKFWIGLSKNTKSGASIYGTITDTVDIVVEGTKVKTIPVEIRSK